MSAVVLSIPIYLLLTPFEFLYIFFKILGDCKYTHTVVDVNYYIESQTIIVFASVVNITTFQYIYESERFFTIVLNGLIALTPLVLVNFLWTNYVVHHQSGSYNLSIVHLQCCLVDSLYTTMIQKMFFLAYFLNISSFNCVFYRRNLEHIDCNHTGVCTVWDQLISIFKEEKTRAIYGITVPLLLWNLSWANVNHWIHLYQEARKIPIWKDKFTIVLPTPRMEAGLYGRSL